MGNCLPWKSTGTKDSKKSSPSNNISKPEKKPVSFKKINQTTPTDAEPGKSKSRKKNEDGNISHNLNTPTKTSSLQVEARNDFQDIKNKGYSTTANLEASGKRNDSKNDTGAVIIGVSAVQEMREPVKLQRRNNQGARFEDGRTKEGETARLDGTSDLNESRKDTRPLEGRPCTASSVIIQVSAVQERSEPVKLQRRNNQGTTGGRSDLFSVTESKEEARFEDGRTKEDETARLDGTSDLNESRKDARNQFPAPGNENVENMSTSGNGKLNESIKDSGNVEDEKEGNRSRKSETCTEGSHKKSIKPPKAKSKRKLKELEARVEGLTEEKNKLLNRLSEIGALKLIDNNPNITDLSDVNRPEKLVDQFSELYDNEWTDAYEHLTKTQGQTMVQSVNLLLQALKETYNICLSSTKERAITLRKAMLSYAGLPDEDCIETELKEIERKMWEYRTKKSECNVSRIGKEVRERLPGQFQQLETETSNSLSLYIDGCVRICWYMCIKNPPMHLDFGENERKTTTDNGASVIRYFNKIKFVTYTKDGEYIDYVVWPAVFLHDGGSIMRKGVAQGARDITNMLVDIK